MIEKKNLPQSILQRLKNRSKENKEDFNLLLVRYGMERFLYRLSISSYRDNFILKGASLFLVWKGQNYRVTRDADFMTFGTPDLLQLKGVFFELCEYDTYEQDGIRFLSESLKVEEIRENQVYDGVRVTLKGLVGKVKIPLQIDIGFGDAITPFPDEVKYPVLLDLPIPELKAYPKYTFVAEKFEAVVSLGFANSRMKDFYDIWLVSKLFNFDGDLLLKAIENTFNRRQTKLPDTIPFALTEKFYNDSQKQVQWKAFVRKAKPDFDVGNFESVISDIKKFLIFIITKTNENSDLQMVWELNRGWLKK